MKKIVGQLTGLALIAGLLLFLVGCQSTYVRSAKIYMQDNDPENAKEVLLEGVKMTLKIPSYSTSWEKSMLNWKNGRK